MARCRLGRRIVHELRLEFLDLLGVAFHDEEVVVHDRVEQRVRQVVGARLADASLALADAFAHRVEHVAGPFLERHHEVPPEDQADLLALDLVRRGIDPQHAADDEDVVRERLDLRPLAGADDVLEGQGVQAEVLAEAGQHVGLVHAVHVDPGHRRRVAQREAVVQVLDRHLGDVAVVVVHDHQAHLFGPVAAGVHDGARRLPGLLAPGMEEAGHRSTSCRRPRAAWIDGTRTSKARSDQPSRATGSPRDSRASITR